MLNRRDLLKMFGVGAASAAIPASLARAVVPAKEIVEVPWLEPPENAPFGFADPPPEPDEPDELDEQLPDLVEVIIGRPFGRESFNLDEHIVVTFHNTKTDEKVHLKVYGGSMSYGQDVEPIVENCHGQLICHGAEYGPLEADLQMHISEVISPVPNWKSIIQKAGLEDLNLTISSPDHQVFLPKFVYQTMSYDNEGNFEIAGVCYT